MIQTIDLLMTYADSRGLGEVIDLRDDMILCCARREVSRTYVRNYGEPPPVVHLVGCDIGAHGEAVPWQHRVPNTGKIAYALNWIVPAEIRRVRPDQYVARQGDVWAIGTPAETLPAQNVVRIGDHELRRDPKLSGWLLVHRRGDHRPLYLPSGYRWRLIANRRVGGLYGSTD